MYLNAKTQAEAVQNALDAIIRCCRYLGCGDEEDGRFDFYAEEFETAHLMMSDERLTDASFKSDTVQLLRRGCSLLDSAGGRFQRRLIQALVTELEAADAQN